MALFKSAKQWIRGENFSSFFFIGIQGIVKDGSILHVLGGCRSPGSLWHHSDCERCGCGVKRWATRLQSNPRILSISYTSSLMHGLTSRYFAREDVHHEDACLAKFPQLSQTAKITVVFTWIFSFHPLHLKTRGSDSLYVATIHLPDIDFQKADSRGARDQLY